MSPRKYGSKKTTTKEGKTEYQKDYMRERRRHEREAQKYVRERVKAFLKAVSVPEDAAFLKGKDALLMLQYWLFPTYLEGMRRMSNNYAYWQDMMHQVKDGIIDNPSTIARRMAQALSHIDGRFMNLALWIMDLEDILTFAPIYFEFMKMHENNTFKTLLEGFVNSEPLEPDHQPGATVLVHKIAKEGEYKDYVKKKGDKK